MSTDRMPKVNLALIALFMITVGIGGVRAEPSTLASASATPLHPAATATRAGHSHIHSINSADISGENAIRRRMEEVLGPGEPKDAPTFSCAAGHPHVTTTPVTVPQRHLSLTHPEVGRRLGELANSGGLLADAFARRQQLIFDDDGGDDAGDDGGSGGNSNDFVSAAAADEMGLAEGLRVRVLYDLVDGGDDRAREEDGLRLQCYRTGEMAYDQIDQTAVPCTEENIINTESRQLMAQHADWAAARLAATLRVNPVEDAIEFADAVADEYAFPRGTSVSDADLVILMLARPASGAAGYASCVQIDEYGSCTVGIFNFVPSFLNSFVRDENSEPNSRWAVESLRRVALHEVLHVLGAVVYGTPFINTATGEVKDVSAAFEVLERESDDFPKPVTLVKSPRVLHLAREHFGCPQLRGIPLEDLPFGAFAHWEARVLGPETMSYGHGSGQQYLSDLTLAFLEDTGRFVANYTMGGRLLEEIGDPLSKEEAEGSMAKFPEEDDDAPEPEPARPGQLRWGRGAGCAFVNASVRDWPSDYICRKQHKSGCTPDRRMSGYCALYRGWEVPAVFTCGSAEACQTELNDNCEDGVCGIPTMFQTFTDEEATAAFGESASGGDTGGSKSSMDYAPVKMGSWHCTDPDVRESEATRGTSSEQRTGVHVEADPDALVALRHNGQTKCPTCRCFTSSLTLDVWGYGDNYTKGDPHLGLCYRFNCASLDLLQIGINSGRDGRNSSVEWYKCPSRGGEIFVRGYVGTLHCPPAREFCSAETVSGTAYVGVPDSDTGLGVLAALTSSGLASMMIGALVFFTPCLASRALSCFTCKRWCGVTHFNSRGKLDHDAVPDPDEHPWTPYAPSEKVLMDKDGEIDVSRASKLRRAANLLSTISANVGFTALIWTGFLGIGYFWEGTPRSVAGATFFLTMGASVVGFSMLGWRTARSKRVGAANCGAVGFWFGLFLSAGMYLYLVAFAVIYPTTLSRAIYRMWPTLVQSLPSGAITQSLIEEERADQILAEYAVGVALFMIVAGILLILQVSAVRVIVGWRVLVATTYSLINHLIVGAGAVFFAVAAHLSTFGAAGLTFPASEAGVVVMGLYCIVAAVYAQYAVFTKTSGSMFLVLMMSSSLLMMTVGMAIVTLRSAGTLWDTIRSLSDEQLTALVDIVGIASGDREELMQQLRIRTRTLGIFGINVFLTSATHAYCASYMLRRIMAYVKSGKRSTDIEMEARRDG